MNPKRLPESDYYSVQQALIDFYNIRPDEYGLLERSQAVYEEYAKDINKIANKTSSVLDIGSGSWRIPDEIAKYGYPEVVGLDYFSPEKLQEYSKQIKNKNARLVSYQDSNIPFQNNSFDVISSLCVVEHIIYVNEFFNEVDRVLKPGGHLIISCPNWSSPLPMLTGLISTLFKKDRFWQIYKPIEAIIGVFRSLFWYLENLVSSSPKFIMIYPKMKDGKINFERSDDDAVHLCQPLSIKKFFKQKNYEIIQYNRGFGSTKFTFLFNWLFPSFASTNFLVFKKSEK
jgi:SAM-dependent methyltransferase